MSYSAMGSITGQDRVCVARTCRMKARSLLLIPVSSFSPIAQIAAMTVDARSNLEDESLSEQQDSKSTGTYVSSSQSFGSYRHITARHISLLRVLLILVSSLDAGRPRLMRLTQLAPSAKLALFPASRRSGRAKPLHTSAGGGPDLAVPVHADPTLVPPDNAAAVEFLLQRPARGGPAASDMASFAAGRHRWADLVGRLLPSQTPEQQRLRSAMLAVDRRCFMEPSTPEALAYEVRV